MPPSRELLSELSGTTAFQPDALEKALRLVELLREINGQPYLKERLALKGGTALNLFHLPMPRLSVDLDFNYIGRVERDGMLEERPRVTSALERVARSLGYPMQLVGRAGAHAGTRWVLPYTEIGGSSDHLEVSVNWLHRVPLLGTERRKSVQLHPAYEAEATLLNLEEIYSGKVLALLTRAEPRDLWDLAHFPRLEAALDRALFRSVTLFYLATGDEDPRGLKVERVEGISDLEIKRHLFPLLRRGHRPSREKLLEIVRPLISELLSFSGDEPAFFDAVNSGELRVELLFEDGDLQRRAAESPAMAWKLQNVQEMKEGKRRRRAP